MNLADDLSRLAKLKDDGILTQEEFDQQKKKLLGKTKGSSRFVTIVAGFVAFVAITGFSLKAIDYVNPRQLACDNPEVQQVVLNAVNQEIDGMRSNFGLLGSHMKPASAHDMSEITEIHRDKGTGFIACAASARIGDDRSDVGYTVSWIDRAGGEFWVKLAHHKELGDLYSKQ